MYSERGYSVERQRCIIEPGYLAISEDPSRLASVCGAGVIVVLWDRVKKRAGMAHCLFPKRKAHEAPTNYHADVAVSQLINEIKTSPYTRNIEAHIFGGAYCHASQKKQGFRIVKTVKKYLKQYRIDIVSEDTAGCIGRKVIFDTVSGDVFVIKTKKVRHADWVLEIPK